MTSIFTHMSEEMLERLGVSVVFPVLTTATKMRQAFTNFRRRKTVSKLVIWQLNIVLLF